jgi:hypothetical protein
MKVICVFDGEVMHTLSECRYSMKTVDYYNEKVTKSSDRHATYIGFFGEERRRHRAVWERVLVCLTCFYCCFAEDCASVRVDE